jgi:hypothetical protein
MAAVRNHVMNINAINPAIVRIPKASECNWGGKGLCTHFRRQFSISLSWALSVWKSQEFTIKGLLAYFLGDSELDQK